MIQNIRRPDGPLSEFIDYFWYLESREVRMPDERSLPDGSADLIVDLTSAREVRMATASNEALRLQSVFLCGPHTRHFVICGSPETRVVEVHFKPGGAFPFLGVPLDELLNAILSMDAIWGRRAGDLREELLEASDVPQLFDVLARRLPQLAARPLTAHPAVRYMLARLEPNMEEELAPSGIGGGVVDSHIQSVVGEIGLSHRRLIDLFRRETGYTPKRYGRIRRFQEGLVQLQEGHPPADWMTLALVCGYYDQSHFIKDFQAFSGLNPAAYERERDRDRGRHRNHVPL